MKKQWKSKVPLLLANLSLIITLYFLVFYSTRIGRLVHNLYTGEEVHTLSWFVGENNYVPLLLVLIVSGVSIFGFLISSRVAVFKKKWLRLLGFIAVISSISTGYAVYGMGKVSKHVIPFFEERLSNVIETDGFVEAILFEHSTGFYLTLLILPILFLGFIGLFLLSEYVLLDKDLNEKFFEYEFKGAWLQKFGKMEEEVKWPDVELGVSIKTNEMVTMPGFDRSLNSIIVGSIGTGKTAALALPMLNQDLHYMTRYINSFPELIEREDYLTKEVAGRHLNGITVIEPSNDLCQKTLQLVKAHGIPDEAITYINPLDPDTPSINPMMGPVDKVAEVFAQILSGLNNSGAGGNSYFEQAQRNHLKQHIYLLKLHDPDKISTLDDLVDMYNNPNLVHHMHEKLKKTIPKGIDLIEERQERNYWKIIQGVDEWFDLTIIEKTEKSTQSKEVSFKDANAKKQYIDAKAEHVQGLRNILNDIGANPYIRNVLFGESSFDFDKHFADGGVLLVNTAKGQLVDLARVLGKIVLMNLQNATFRRPNDVSPFHHIMIDEAPDYFYDSFREFPVQSRKYKVITTSIMQTIAQLADQFGEHYMTTIIAGMRNRMVYGDVPDYDAEYFSKLFGEKVVFEEGQTEMSVSPLQDNPQTRGGSSYSKKKEQAMSGGDIMFQDAFNCAVKIVKHNKPMPVERIKANFLPPEAFKESKIKVEEESLNKWLSHKRGDIITIGSQEDTAAIENVDQELVEMNEKIKMEKIAQSNIGQENKVADNMLPISKKVMKPTDPNPRGDMIPSESYLNSKSVWIKNRENLASNSFVSILDKPEAPLHSGNKPSENEKGSNPSREESGTHKHDVASSKDWLPSGVSNTAKDSSNGSQAATSTTGGESADENLSGSTLGEKGETKEVSIQVSEEVKPKQVATVSGIPFEPMLDGDAATIKKRKQEYHQTKLTKENENVFNILKNASQNDKEQDSSKD